MNRKQYIKFALIYYPLSFVALFVGMYLTALGNRPSMGGLTGIGFSIIALSIYIRCKYGKRRLQYINKSNWWLVFCLIPLTEPLFHIAMCVIKDREDKPSLENLDNN